MPEQDTKSVALLAAAILIASQVPTSLAAVEPAWLRGSLQLVALVVVVACSVWVQPRAVSRAVSRSLWPPADPEKTPAATPLAKKRDA